MWNATVIAFVLVAAAPLVGIWRGHVWAKQNGFSLRTTQENGLALPGETA